MEKRHPQTFTVPLLSGNAAGGRHVLLFSLENPGKKIIKPNDDVTTGRLHMTKRITGSATACATILQLSPQVKSMNLPLGIESFKNTPREEAIRSCIEQAAQTMICSDIPSSCYRHSD